jgi:hypothetical protein
MFWRITIKLHDMLDYRFKDQLETFCEVCEVGLNVKWRSEKTGEWLPKNQIKTVNVLLDRSLHAALGGCPYSIQGRVRK